jgi:hypothetical protein
MNPDDVGTLVGALQTNAERLGLTWQMRLAEVVDDSSVIFDGDGTVVSDSITNITGQQLTAGDRVYVMSVPPAGNYVTGFATPRFWMRQQILTTTTAVVIFNNIPASLSRLEIFWRGATNLAGAVSARMDVNGDSSVQYTTLDVAGTGGAVATEQLASSAFYIGVTGGATSASPGSGTIWCNDWNQYTLGLGYPLNINMINGSGNPTNNYTRFMYGKYASGLTTPKTKLQFFCDAGASWLRGSLFRIEGTY